MKKIYYLAVLGLTLFEIANVFFIMPMPGSQEINSIHIAYFLNHWRWLFRIAFYLILLFCFFNAFQSSRLWSILGLLLLSAVTYTFNFELKADHIFYEPKILSFKNASENLVDKDRIIIGVVMNQEAKAYPVSFLAYHHQVRDTIAGKPIMVTYCTVCRSGRVFDPSIDGRPEVFRLVGMDHYNAMFEDETTKSWWRQENGEAVAGSLKGKFLQEIPSQQASLESWLKMYPNSLIMQADSQSISSYDSLAKFELGKSTSRLTKYDTLSWNDKSWIVGIQSGTQSIAIDWNKLISKRQIHFMINNTPSTLLLASDKKSFFAFQCPANEFKLIMVNDTIHSATAFFNLKGENISNNDTIPDLIRLNAYQEYWQSWKLFHPNTQILK